MQYFKYEHSLMDPGEFEMIAVDDKLELADIESEIVAKVLNNSLPFENFEYYDSNHFGDLSLGIEYANEICIYYNFDDYFEESEYVQVYYRKSTEKEYCDYLL